MFNYFENSTRISLKDRKEKFITNVWILPVWARLPVLARWHTHRGNSREHNEGTTSTRNGEAAKGSVCNSLKSLKPYPETANRRHCDGIYESSHTMWKGLPTGATVKPGSSRREQGTGMNILISFSLCLLISCECLPWA